MASCQCMLIAPSDAARMNLFKHFNRTHGLFKITLIRDNFQSDNTLSSGP